MIPTHVLGVVYVLMFLLAVIIHGRQVEWTARLDFLWQIQANEEKREMDALQHSNKRILFNLLPAHVATHFLDNQFRSHMVSEDRFLCLLVTSIQGVRLRVARQSFQVPSYGIINIMSFMGFAVF